MSPLGLVKTSVLPATPVAPESPVPSASPVDLASPVPSASPVASAIPSASPVAAAPGAVPADLQVELDETLGCGRRVWVRGHLSPLALATAQTHTNSWLK